MKSKFNNNLDSRYLILFGLLGTLFIHSFIKYGILNQVVGSIMPRASAQVPVINSPNGFVPDWSRLKFSDMIISEDGSVTYPGSRGTETRSWTAGQSIAEFMELGDFETPQLAIENLNLSTIASVQGVNLNRLRLDDFQLTRWQTLPNLATAVPGLGNRSVASVPPIRDFARRFGINSGTIANASRNSRLRNVQLGRGINLRNYALTSIPNIQNASINRFANWQDSKIIGVPGLSTLTWDNLPGLRSLDLSFVAKVDLPLRDIEANRTRSISGSYQEGFNVPCLQNNCAHMEMSGLGKTTGTQWISGKYQKVNGGFGLLKALNGGKEPTGRNPFGSSFKQVVWNIYEGSGEVETAMFFRICKTIPFIGRTCSPYFIGPVPFIEYREKDPIVLGKPNSLP
ncbi:hypothetical protein ACN23B_28025 (plasmid) [Anabaena sp. FACHB-709]|uniref:Uncharacterized protein n=2 Tax=Nostocaceae TaxID=1162 RepID=A0A1Z4KUU4_ANAVA|nr:MULTISPECIES: hypothetical protein [Nostocaceae]BAY72612.1 hypothetical protein NIES23_54400 [Trichormus variabilis NIES-23]MBD2174198.1 hypothetical protein [Anabaena cylindrica FACHB-318]MBD2265986.1 hypothetical protein [Anabaena sp. FACHB-709]MBD2275481.1 hypothetical protein [Nostoc sp. PCC 7120 = FACHB-418]MBD2286306.1 hypothetical protein [Anabaena cylindrica FACHB-170]